MRRRGGAEHTQRANCDEKEGRKEQVQQRMREENGAIIHYKLNTLDDDNAIAFQARSFLRCEVEAEMRLSLIGVLESGGVIHNL